METMSNFYFRATRNEYERLQKEGNALIAHRVLSSTLVRERILDGAKIVVGRQQISHSIVLHVIWIILFCAID